MTTLTPTQTLLQETKQAFSMVKGSTLVAMQKLAEVKEKGAWESVSPNWGEYVEAELGISQSFASKLLTVHKAYLSDGGLQPLQLHGVDYERLYLARELPGTPEQRVAMAKTLSRRELKETKVENSDHEHTPKTITVCDTCGMRL